MQRHERVFRHLLNGFLRDTVGSQSAEDAKANFLAYNYRWQQHCANINANYPWVKADPYRFEAKTQEISAKAQRKLQPGKYYFNNYGLKLIGATALGGIIYIITERVWPWIWPWLQASGIEF
jgi:hypothetical protein